MEEQILFIEKQKPSQWWLSAIIIFYILFLSLLVYEQLFKGIPFLSFNIPDNALISLWVLFGIIVPIGFFTSELNIIVKSDGLYIKYFPFHWDYLKIPFDDFDDFEIITYNPLKDYGGWGVRYGQRGNAYSAHGNKGINLKMKYARDLLIGSQESETFYKALVIATKEYKEKEHHNDLL